MMKKLLILSMALGLAVPAMAQDVTQKKIQLIKKMYDDGRKQDDDMIMDYADKNLKKLFQRNLKLMEREDGVPCIEFSPMWDSQDPETKVKVQVSALKNGQIRAQFPQYQSKQVVDYDVACDKKGQCAISNVYHYYENEKSSFADNLAECLKENNG